MPDVLELVQAAVLADRDEDTILSVDVGRAEWFADHGHDADALLAGRLRDELFHPAAEARDLFGQGDRELVAAGLADSPIIAPSVAPGLCAAGIVRSDAVCISSARSSTSWSGAPMSAAGTRPKYESAEYRPPMSSGLTNTARKPRSRASVSSDVPGR